MPSKSTPRVYRDEPGDDAASTSSAVLMQDIDYPEAALPAYEEVVASESIGRSTTHEPEPQSYLTQPLIPASHLSRDKTTTTTHWPEYSEDPSALQEMLEEQAKYPPIFTARITGTHSETVHKKDKKEKTAVTDFDIRLDMTHLLVPGSNTPNNLKIQGLQHASAGTQVYQGHRIKSIVTGDFEPGVGAAIQGYTSSAFPVRSFTLRRQILHHDSAALKNLLTSLVGSTNYRGHLKVTFPITHDRVTVYSPCWQNRLRDKTWLRWIFYLTFLWIFAWPYLWFMTRRWEVLTSQFPYSCSPECGNRKFVTQSEKAFFEEWRPSLRRAILGKKQGWIDEEYKLGTEDALRQAGTHGIDRIPITGNAVADGALGFLHHATTMRRDIAMAGGWGADS